MISDKKDYNMENAFGLIRRYNLPQKKIFLEKFPSERDTIIKGFECAKRIECEIFDIIGIDPDKLSEYIMLDKTKKDKQ